MFTYQCLQRLLVMLFQIWGLLLVLLTSFQCTFSCLVSDIRPSIVSILNILLTVGCVFPAFKTAVVFPHLGEQISLGAWSLWKLQANFQFRSFLRLQFHNGRWLQAAWGLFIKTVFLNETQALDLHFYQNIMTLLLKKPKHSTLETSNLVHFPFF